MKFSILSLFLFISFTSVAQPKVDTKTIKDNFPEENFYVVTDKTDLVISIKENKLEIKSTINVDLLFLSENAPMYSRRSIYYYDETEEISNATAASYLSLGNGKYKKVEVDKMYTHKPVKNGVFYDDFKELYFDFPGLKEGSLATMSYQVKDKDPHFIDPYFFANNSPSKDMEYSVTFPKDVRLKYVMKGDTSNIKFSTKESKGITTYTWSVSNQRSFDKEREEGNYRRYAPHVIVYIEWYKINNDTVRVLGSPDQLYSWYSTHIAGLIKTPEKAVKVLADSLTLGLTSEKDKIKAIYYWVQENIKYIAFEYGLGGFIPRDADLVRSRRYGDCKDKSSLLYSLLKAAGIPSYFTWIGTREIPYSYSELATPAANNHMILAVLIDNEWVFLDGTSSYLPLGYPSGFIQEKEALIGITLDSFVVVKVPAIDHEKNFKSDSVSVTIEGESIVGKGFSKYGGLWRNSVCNAFYNVAEKDKEKELKRLLSIGNNKCRIDSIMYAGLDGYIDSLSFDYSISVPDYAKKVEKKLFVNLNLRKTLQDDEVVIEKRKTEERFNFKYVIEDKAVLIVPKEYKVLKVPENSSYQGTDFGYEITYKSVEGKVLMQKRIYFNQLTKGVEQFVDWNKMVEKITDSYSQVVVVEQI